MLFLRLGLDGRASGAEMAYRVADICDSERIRSLMVEFRAEIIFHAAAYEHVPLMESNAQEAVKNNVLALVSLLDLASPASVCYVVGAARNRSHFFPPVNYQ